MNAWRGHALHSSWDTSLEEFNRLVLQYQDEAFSLAFYMLGSEVQAGQVVQSAVRQAYTHFKGRNPDFRTQILELVSAGCLQAHIRTPEIKAQADTLLRQLSSLPGRERLALILIDLLELSYTQAGSILHQPRDSVRGLLTQGRLKLRKSDRF